MEISDPEQGPDLTPEPPQISGETVEALVETTRKFLDTEDAQEQSVNTRGGGVVVFGGIILSLLASLGQTVLVKDLPDGWDEATTVLFGLAVGGLLLSVTLTLFYVLLPRQSASIAMEEIERYGELEVLSQPRVAVQGVLLEGLIRVLAIDRERVSRKTTWLARAYGGLVIGLFAVAALGLILAGAESGLMTDKPDPKPPAAVLVPPRPFQLPKLDYDKKDVDPAARPSEKRHG